MDEAKLVDGLDSEDNLSNVETSNILAENLILDKHGHQITTRQELHQHIQEVLVLESGVQLDDPRGIRLGENITLGADVGELVTLEHLGLDEGLHGVDAVVGLLLHKLDFAECALANDLQRLVVLWLGAGAEEAEELALLSAVLGPSCFLACLRDIWVLKFCLQLLLSVSWLVYRHIG